jgi:hypothetical protein
MNFKQLSACLGIAAGTVLSLSTTSAQAASLTPDSLGLPTFSSANPVGNGLSAPGSQLPYAATQFAPSKDLTVKFSVSMDGLGSRGKGQSNFGFFTFGTDSSKSFTSLFTETLPYDPGSNARKNDWLGTCNVSILICETTVTFKAGTTYQLALESLSNPQKTKYTSYILGSPDTYTYDTVSDQYYPLVNGSTTVDAFGTVLLGAEDGEFKVSSGTHKGETYYDYQDWVVKAEAVPEPTTLAGLGIVGGMLLSRRKRKAGQAV